MTLGNQTVIATNDGKTSPKFRVQHSDGNISYTAHAETRALISWKHYDHPERLKVTVKRVRKDGTLGIAKPCVACQAAMWRAGIKPSRVWFSNEDGVMERFRK